MVQQHNLITQHHNPFRSRLFTADSKSVPDITNPATTLSSGNSVVTATRSAGSPLPTWPKKLSGFIAGKSKNSDLTEERLREFNRRNALIEARYSGSSPYYKGLTDFSLDINREKHLGSSSPGRESHATSSSSFVLRVQECFIPKKNDRAISAVKPSHDGRSTSSSSSSRATETVFLTKIRAKKTKNGSVSVEKRVFVSPSVEKPLRERDSEPSPSPMLLPLSPPMQSPPESLPYPLPVITLPAAQVSVSLSPPPTPPPLEALHLLSDEKEMTRKYIWADKYRPFWLREFLCNREKALWLQEIVRTWHDTNEECGHFIFEGNSGVGKRTMIWALLREAFGPDKVQAREESKTFFLKGEAVSSILVNLMVSPQHVEVNLSELKGYEKHVIVELIKEKRQIDSGTTLNCKRENCKAIILYDADKLSMDALAYIKWMLEKFKECNKVFFCCKDAKKLQHIMPLCRYVQLNEPSVEEIISVLKFIAEKEGIQLPHQLAYKIASNSQNNLRQAVRSFEATWHASGVLTEDQDIKTGWEDKIANIAKDVLQEQSPKQLYNIRGELQILIEHNVAPEFIFQTLKKELEKILPQQLQPEFDHLYNEYRYQKSHAGKKYLPYAHQEGELGDRKNDQIKNVQKFIRIEEFIARFMSWYKGSVVKNSVSDQITKPGRLHDGN